MTRLYGILGDPIAHSLSPEMHTAAFRRLGLDAAYLAFRVSRPELGEALEGARALGVRGLNLTLPLKEEALRHVKPDREARRAGSINTVDVARNRGTSTDGPGAIAALREAHVPLRGTDAVLLGAGGAARAIAHALAEAGAHLHIANRTPQRARALAREVGAAGGGLPMVKQWLPRAGLLVNATPMGMHPRRGECPVEPRLLRSGMVVFDSVYNPRETRLLREARMRGCKTVEGIGMLVHQGALSLRGWTGRRPPVDAMRHAVIEALERPW